MRHLLFLLTLLSAATVTAYAADLPLFDAHIHYSEEAWQRIPPKEAIALLRKAGVKRALVSSTNDDGNQKLFAEAPDLILPSLRTYRTRSDISTWYRDESVATYMRERLKKYRYAAIVGARHQRALHARLAQQRDRVFRRHALPSFFAVVDVRVEEGEVCSVCGSR